MISPHILIYTSMRWHVRAYCEKNRTYRDFVSSRFRGAPEFERMSENLIDADDDQNT